MSAFFNIHNFLSFIMPWGVFPYYAARGVVRGARAVGRVLAAAGNSQAGKRAVAAAGAAAAGQMLGYARAAMARRRRAKAWAYMKSYREKAALGLGSTRYLSTCKFPLYHVIITPQAYNSYTCRINPMHSGTVTNYHQDVPSIFAADPRFRAMCGLYKQFRIVNMKVMLSVDASAVASKFTDVSLAARVIRNVTNATPYTTFLVSQYTDCISVPGVIWKRRFDKDRTVKFSINISPKSGVEKMQWYGTSYNASYNSTEWLAGADWDFCPCLDFGLIVYKVSTSSDDDYIPVQVWTRYSIIFRDAIGGELPNSKIEVDATSENLRAMQNAVAVQRANIPTIQPAEETVVLDK